MTPQFRHTLLAAAAHPYHQAGSFAWHFAKGKLGGDPVFFGILENGIIPDCRRLVDIGCGQGLLASWLPEARKLYEAGNWPAKWPAPPKVDVFWGLELMPKDIDRARSALGGHAQFVQGDMRTADFGKADAVVIMDVLHYINYAAQEDVLRRVRAALPPGGRFITRIGDAAGGLPFHLSNWVDRAVFFIRGHRLDKLYCRTLGEWQALLSRNGFDSTPLPMSRGTPFANVMLIARAV
jgi:SAM-dependent methyltransferase